MSAKKASVKFRVYAEDKPLKDVAIHLGSDSLLTNQTGIALFSEFNRFESYNWSASREGYEGMAGSLVLGIDTTVNVSMNLLTHTSIPVHEGITLYPNPAHSTFFVKSREKITRIEICDLRGAVIGLLDANNRSVEFNISIYPPDIYIVNIFREGLRTVSMKLIKSE